MLAFMSDTVPLSNRRRGERHFACFPASLERPDGEQRTSIIRDLSGSGALLLVRTTKIAVGDRVKLELYITDDPTTFRVVMAAVVRVEELVPGDAGPWLRRVGVKFESPVSVYAEEIATFQERARRLGLE
jgi:hypothetical protein